MTQGLTAQMEGNKVKGTLHNWFGSGRKGLIKVRTTLYDSTFDCKDFRIESESYPL